MRCIDADKLHYKKVYISSGWDVAKSSVVVFAKEIDKAPQFEVVETSKWIKNEKGSTVCQNCGGYTLLDIVGSIVESHYCPHCGRKMIGDKNE